MITLIGCPRKPKAMTRAEFTTYWWENHAPLVLSVPEFMRHVRQYTQYHLIEDPDRPGEYLGNPCEYDGVGMISFSNAEAMEAAFNEPKYLEIIQPDEKRMKEPGDEMLWFVAHERIVHDDKNGPADSGITLIGCPRKPKAMTRAEFNTYWWENHAPLVLSVPEFTRHVGKYMQYHLIEDPARPGEYLGNPCEYDGVGLVSFSNAEAMQAAFSERKYLEIIQPDEERMKDPGGDTLWFVAHEKVVHDDRGGDVI